jgi:rhodanese-related sulfurtransferase
MEQFSEFASNNLLLVLALMVTFFVLVFSELRRKASGLVAVDPTEAVGLINGDAVVVDLRGADSFALGHIVNARNIPIDELDAGQERLASFKSKPILTVCQSGVTSTKAVAKLRKSGFESVYGIKGGMAAWSQAGLPVVTGKKTKSKNKGKK